MKKGWKIEKLGNVCKTSAGGTPLKSHKNYYENGTIPWLRSGEVNNKNILDSEIKITKEGLNNSSAKLFPPETVVIAMYGATAGQVGILNFECSTNQAVCGILPNKNFITEYIYYFFLNYKEKLIAQAVGNAQPNISQAKIKDSLIPVLPLTEQKQIVAKLDKAFAAIDKAEANTKQNIANAKELFQSRLDEIFTNGANSKGWVTKKLGDIGKVSMCKRILKRQTKPQGDIPFYKIGTFGKKPNAYISKDIYEEYKNKYSFPKKGEILISASGTIGRRVIYDGLPAYFQDSNIVWIENNQENVTNDYLYKFYGYCDWNPSKGATISRLYNDDLRKIKISFPTDNKTQEKIVKELDKLREATDKLVANYEKKLSDLEELRKSLLEQAFLGNLT